MTPVKIGLVGCGAIGGYLAKELAKKTSTWDLIGLHDQSVDNARSLSEKLTGSTAILSLPDLVDKADVIVEAASVSAVPLIIDNALAARQAKKVVIISVGALLIYPEIKFRIEQSSLEVVLPSGALAGLDALKSAAREDLEQVRLFTRKPVKSVAGAPYLAEKSLDLSSIDSPTIIFQGNALEAVSAFPKNINVAATVSFAGIGPEKTEVIIEVSPTYTTNSHELVVTGKFGSFRARTENRPFPQNPKTSFLAALSALQSVTQLVDNLRVGC